MSESSAAVPAGVTPADGIAHTQSLLSVEETVARLIEAIEVAGAKLFTVVDHSGEAASAGLALRDTKLIIFGSPVAGTPVMVASPLAAIDLPLKVLVWADGEHTKVSYVSPSALAARYHLSPELAANLAGINPLTDALVAP
jgi:uncharacterized protein (DUF302 family)